MKPAPELEQLRALMHEGIERLSHLASGGRTVSPESLEHAKLLRSEAAKLRRRRMKLAGSEGLGEDRADLERKARYFDERAGYLESGDPMPRHLRTASETLAAVDDLRRRLAVVLEEVGEYLHDEDLEAFRGAMGQRGHEIKGIAGNYAAAILSYLKAVVMLLGVELTEEGARFAPFASPADGAQVFVLRDDEPPTPVER